MALENQAIKNLRRAIKNTFCLSKNLIAVANASPGDIYVIPLGTVELSSEGVSKAVAMLERLVVVAKMALASLLAKLLMLGMVSMRCVAVFG